MKYKEYSEIESVCNLANDLVQELKQINRKTDYGDELVEFIFDNMQNNFYCDADDFLEEIKEELQEGE